MNVYSETISEEETQARLESLFGAKKAKLLRTETRISKCFGAADTVYMVKRTAIFDGERFVGQFWVSRNGRITFRRY